jgi:hypothetical protein
MEEAARPAPSPKDRKPPKKKRIQFWITAEYYGGDIDLIEQAARDCGAQLVAVKGYDLKDYPGKRDYVEGNAEYLFVVERDALVRSKREAENARRDAAHFVHFTLRERARELYIQKYGG